MSFHTDEISDRNVYRIDGEPTIASSVWYSKPMWKNKTDIGGYIKNLQRLYTFSIKEFTYKRKLY